MTSCPRLKVVRLDSGDRQEGGLVASPRSSSEMLLENVLGESKHSLDTVGVVAHFHAEASYTTFK